MLLNKSFLFQEEIGYSGQIKKLELRLNNQKVEIKMLQKEYEEAVAFRDNQKHEQKYTRLK